MSLNWKEIDLIISELDVVGAQIQRVTQPAYDTLVLSLYKPGKATELLFCVAHGACRLHETRLSVPKAEKPQRFMELLRSQLRGSRIDRIAQLGTERIVEMRIGSGEMERLLYARLWSGAANLILAMPDGTIIDALSRKPSKGEVHGGVYVPEAGPPPTKEFAIRDLPGDGSFNGKVDAWYAERGSELSREALLEKAGRYFDRRAAFIELRLDSLSKKAIEYADAQRQKELGDILMANQGQRPQGQSLEADDFYRGGTVVIKVDPRASMVANAEAYYEKARKARSGAAEVASGIADAEAELARLASEREAIGQETNPHAIRAFLAKKTAGARQEPRSFPGISLERDGWRIFVGRTAAENDELLRRHVRGNDTWFHARDYAGSYVFVKAKAGKTVPLDIMIDAGTLAIYYSKARSSGKGALYYTQAKYLRRAKDGPKGLVIPTQERNLNVVIDERRLKELKRLIGVD